MKINRWEIPIHLLFWGLSFWILNEGFAVINIQESLVNGENETIIQKEYSLIWPIFFTLIGKAIFVYVNAFVLIPGLMQRKKWPLFLSKVLLWAGLAMGIEAGLNLLFRPSTAPDDFYLSFIAPPLNGLLIILFGGLSTAYALGKNYIKGEQQKQQLRQEMLSAELNFLKAQINPHFLFNTLNNLFAIAERNQQAELSTGIAELSNLMRYMLYDAKADQVLLEKEIAYIRSVIEIQQLRLSEEDQVLIALNITGELHKQKIAPLILIPFVENAFKHGIKLHHDAFIKINGSLQGNAFTFTVVNSNFQNQKNDLDHPAGIGLENVKKRLDLIYPNQYQLDIQANADSFSVHLHLHLKT